MDRYKLDSNQWRVLTKSIAEGARRLEELYITDDRDAQAQVRTIDDMIWKVVGKIRFR